MHICLLPADRQDRFIFAAVITQQSQQVWRAIVAEMIKPPPQRCGCKTCAFLFAHFSSTFACMKGVWLNSSGCTLFTVYCLITTTELFVNCVYDLWCIIWSIVCTKNKLWRIVNKDTKIEWPLCFRSMWLHDEILHPTWSGCICPLNILIK